MKVCLTCGEKQLEGTNCNGCGHMLINEPPPFKPRRQELARKESK
jgi:hypothetical protein